MKNEEKMNTQLSLVMLMNALKTNGFEAYMVGGAVRDMLMNVEPHDYDVCTNARPNDVMNVAKTAGFGVWTCETGLASGTVTVRVNGNGFEVTTYRLDKETDGRRAKVQFADTLEEDLARRDFTFNAMAMDMEGNVTDLFGGRDDLRNGVVRFVGNADDRLREDYLRMMRAVRFATRFGFKLDADAFAAVKRNAHMVHRLSAERVRDEVLKTLGTDQPAHGVWLMDQVGLLAEVLPEVSALKGMEQRSDFHHKDVFGHTMLVLDNMAEQTKDPVLRFAALMHDVGKPKCRTFTPGVGYQFVDHEVVGATMANDVCVRFKMTNDETKLVRRLVREHLRLTQLKDVATPKAVRRMLRHFAEKCAEPGFENFFDHLVMLTRADMTSHQPKKVAAATKALDDLLKMVEEVKTAVPVSTLCSPLNGTELMELLGLSTGREVGELKEFLTNAVLDGLLEPGDKETAKKMVMDRRG